MVYDQLSGYGQMTDNALNDWFLKRGGFLILLDGLNEISQDSARTELGNFVSRNWRRNYFCLSSQQSYPEFSGLGRVDIQSLSREKVEELLKQRLGQEKAEEAIKEFDDETYKLYSIPRDLEFAVEIVQRGHTTSFPRSRAELYKETLAPIIGAWASNGHGDYADILWKRAYDMLCQRDSFFDSASTSMPDEIRNELYERRYLFNAAIITSFDTTSCAPILPRSTLPRDGAHFW